VNNFQMTGGVTVPLVINGTHELHMSPTRHSYTAREIRSVTHDERRNVVPPDLANRIVDTRVSLVVRSRPCRTPKNSSNVSGINQNLVTGLDSGMKAGHMRLTTKQDLQESYDAKPSLATDLRAL
jgi:hypothetical protein